MGGPVEKAHGRIENRSIDVLPAQALPSDTWPTIRQICRIRRSRRHKKNGIRQEPEEETVFLITSLPRDQASPKRLLDLNRHHWAIENNLHRNKDVILGEDRVTSRLDHAPRNISAINNLVLCLLRRIHPSPTLAIERCQDNKNLAISITCGFQ
jgi:predicted transposase YbfD/YdcC